MIAVFLKMFGIFVGCSAIRFHFRQNFITERQLTKIVSAYLCAQLVSSAFVENFYLQWMIICVPIVGVGAFLFFYLQRLETQFRYEFPDIITALILRMKMGSGFRKSFQDVIAYAPKKYGAILLHVRENVVFSPQQSDKKLTEVNPFLREIIVEFKKVDQSAHRSIEMLENFRRRLSVLNDFRRRSGRIRGQVRLQASVLVVIYALCFAFVAWTFSLHGLEGLIFLSAALFVLGLLLIFYLGRKVKWKI